jgi:hypothetical protein
VLALMLASGAHASAQALADLDEAHRAIDEADFPAAVLALDHAAASAMTHDELLRWLELHSLLAFADGRLGALEEALHGYATLLAPGQAPSSSLPRPLRERLAELEGERITVRGEPAVTVANGARVLAMPTTVVEDPGHLVRRVDVRVRVGDAEPVALAPGETVALPGDVHADVEIGWTLSAVGPGGAIVQQVDETGTTIAGLPRSSDDALIGGIVAGAVALVGVAVVLAWGASDNWWRGSVTSVHGALVTF